MERVLGVVAVTLLACLFCAPGAIAKSAAHDSTLTARYAGASKLKGAAAAKRAANDGTVIVRYVDGAGKRQRTLAGRVAGVLETLGSVVGVGARRVRVAGDPVTAAARLNRSRAVLYAEPNYTYRVAAIPNDPLFGELYGLHNSGQRGGTVDADIDAPEGWDNAGLGAFPAPLDGAKIGIVDTGVRADHEDLAGKVVDCAGVASFGVLGLFGNPSLAPGNCEDDNGHGTHVAGIAAAWANNGKGIAGVAVNSPLAICKGLGRSGNGSLAAVANCIVWLSQQGAKVISLSLSGPGATTMQNAIAAVSGDALVVAAVGNTGSEQLRYPSAYPQVVSVGALDRNGARAPFSTTNADLELAAPGVEVLSTWSDGAYKEMSGTSMAAPYVAGAAAVVATRNPAGGPSDWRAKLTGTAIDLATTGRDAHTGFGGLNLADAVR